MSANRRLAFLALCVALLPASKPAFSQDTAPVKAIVDVTVDWEIKLIQTVADKSLPQIITVLSQDATVDHRFHILEINHATAPNFVAGGFQEQNWNGKTRTSYKAVNAPGVSLNRAGEAVRFRQSMALRDVTTDAGTTKYLYFGIRELQSDTWGSSTNFTRSGSPTKLTSLNSFNIATCLRESGIVAGSDRVEYMKIDRIEYTDISGKIVNDSTDYFVKSASLTTTSETKLTPFEVDRLTAY